MIIRTILHIALIVLIIKIVMVKLLVPEAAILEPSPEQVFTDPIPPIVQPIDNSLVVPPAPKEELAAAINKVSGKLDDLKESLLKAINEASCRCSIPTKEVPPQEILTPLPPREDIKPVDLKEPTSEVENLRPQPPPLKKPDPQALVWTHGMDTAKQLSSQLDRPILVFFHMQGCLPCEAFKTGTLDQPTVQQWVRTRFVPADIYSDDYANRANFFVANSYGVTRFPKVVIINSRGKASPPFSPVNNSVEFEKQVNDALAKL